MDISALQLVTPEVISNTVSLVREGLQTAVGALLSNPDFYKAVGFGAGFIEGMWESRRNMRTMQRIGPDKKPYEAFNPPALPRRSTVLKVIPTLFSAANLIYRQMNGAQETGLFQGVDIIAAPLLGSYLGRRIRNGIFSGAPVIE
jgi:hypothetical protein